jgi:hypothetical protein
LLPWHPQFANALVQGKKRGPGQKTLAGEVSTHPAIEILHVTVWATYHLLFVSNVVKTSVQFSHGDVQAVVNSTAIKELKAETSPLLSPGLLLDLHDTCAGYLNPSKVVLGPHTPGTFVSKKGALELAGQVMQRANMAVLENPDDFAASVVEAEKVFPLNFMPFYRPCCLFAC